LEPAKYEPIAEEYLRLYPARVVFFTKRPMPQKPYIPPNVTVLPKKEEPKPEIKEPVAEAQEIVKDAINDVLQPGLSGKSPRKKTTKKSAKKKTDE